MLFSKFDFRVLDAASYKEDAVREDIIAPILRKAGYAESGDAQMVRSKPLVHPFVKIGSMKRKINIIPDYTLYFQGQPVLVLDAKAPTENIIQSEHCEQAYSYAIHPEVRAQHYGLCNGKRLVIYKVDAFNPILDIETNQIDAHWKLVEKAISPRFLLNPSLREYLPDFGLAVIKLGIVKPNMAIIALATIQSLGKVTDDLYTASALTTLEPPFILGSFDMSRALYEKLLAELPDKVATFIRCNMSHTPFIAELEGTVLAVMQGRLGEPTMSEAHREEFVPIIVERIEGVEFKPEFANFFGTGAKNKKPAK